MSCSVLPTASRYCGHLEAALADGRLELVVKGVRLALDHRRRHSHRGVGDRRLDDPVAVLALDHRLARRRQAGAHVVAQRRQRVELAGLLGELVVERRHDLLFDLLHGHGEGHGLALEVLGLVVGGELQVEARRVADGQAFEVLLEARDEVALADLEHVVVGLRALERHVVDARRRSRSARSRP